MLGALLRKSYIFVLVLLLWSVVFVDFVYTKIDYIFDVVKTSTSGSSTITLTTKPSSDSSTIKCELPGWKEQLEKHSSFWSNLYAPYAHLKMVSTKKRNVSTYSIRNPLLVDNKRFTPNSTNNMSEIETISHMNNNNNQSNDDGNDDDDDVLFVSRWQRRALPDIIVHQSRSDYDILLPQIANAYLKVNKRRKATMKWHNSTQAEQIILDLKKINPMTRILDWRHHLPINSKIRPLMSNIYDSKTTILGFDKIILKNEYAQSVEIATQALGRNFTSFYPRSTSINSSTDIVNDTLKVIKEESHSKNNNTVAWVFKPDHGAESKGVEFYESSDALISILQSENFTKELSDGSSFTIQKMVHPPFLFNKRKFELRIFFTVSSIRPLVVDMYTDGVSRIAQRPYASATSFQDKCAHFTTEQNLRNACSSNGGSYNLHKKCKPKTITGLLDLISAEVGQNVTTAIWQKIADRTLRIAMLMRHRHFEARNKHGKIDLYAVDDVGNNISASTAATTTMDYLLDDNGFQMVGLDTIFDADGNLLVFEANASPSLHPREGYMNFTRYVESHLRIAGILPPVAESIAHKAGYYEFVTNRIDKFAQDRNLTLSDYDRRLLLNIARGHDEPLHDGHWRVYPSIDKFDEFATQIENWPSEDSWIKSSSSTQQQDVVDDIIVRDFLKMYTESS